MASLAKALRFEILSGDVVIGWSDLEYGDPPMGVAHGRLEVTAAYASLKAGATLRVRPVGGAFLEPAGGVHIEDLSAELGPDEIEISVLGLDYVIYERHFPQHVKAYEDSFK